MLGRQNTWGGGRGGGGGGVIDAWVVGPVEILVPESFAGFLISDSFDVNSGP
jgi:hypothetical protein